MDFSVPGSDLWESTPTQDLFIESYFHHKEEPLHRNAAQKRKMVACGKTAEYQHKSLKLESTKEPQLADTNQGQLLNRKSRKRKRRGRKVLGNEERESVEHPEIHVESKESIVKIRKNKLEVSRSLNEKQIKKSGYKGKLETESALIEENVQNNSLFINKKSGRKFQDSKIHTVNPHVLNPKFLPPKPKKLKLDQKTKLKSSKNSECPTEESMPSPKINKSMVTKNMKNEKKSKDIKDSESESENSTSILKSPKPNPTKKLKKKKSLKSDYLENCSQDDQECHSEEFQTEESMSCPNTKKLMVLKNKKNKRSKDIEESESERLNLISNPNLKKPTSAKKLKKKKSLRSDLHLENFSEDDQDESDDEKIVSDIKNSSIFKEIQKLMQEAPFLQNLQDSDDTVGEESGSSSDSNMSESDSIENEDNEVRKYIGSKTTQIRSPVKTITLSKEPTITQNKLYFPTSNQASFPKVVKSCDFPRTLVENSSDCHSMKDNLGKNKAKLQGAKFRYLNEKLYTETGENAFKYFQENKEEFDDYHRGYSLQVSKWPMNPVDRILSDLEDIDEGAVIADMGCGDAKIARTLTDHTIHSFDIVALNDHVTPCNISKVPLAKESVDIVIFCLSLMGTNLKEYLLEAHRILKMGGTLKIAEVESRIEDANAFINKLKFLGFSLKEKDLEHKMFVFLDFKKVKKKVKKDKIPSLALKPCLYKKR